MLYGYLVDRVEQEMGLDVRSFLFMMQDLQPLLSRVKTQLRKNDPEERLRYQTAIKERERELAMAVKPQVFTALLPLYPRWNLPADDPFCDLFTQILNVIQQLHLVEDDQKYHLMLREVHSRLNGVKFLIDKTWHFSLVNVLNETIIQVKNILESRL